MNRTRTWEFLHDLEDQCRAKLDGGDFRISPTHLEALRQILTVMEREDTTVTLLYSLGMDAQRMHERISALLTRFKDGYGE